MIYTYNNSDDNNSNNQDFVHGRCTSIYRAPELADVHLKWPIGPKDIYIYIYIYVCMYVYMYTSIYLSIYLSIYIYIYIYTHTHIRIYIYIYIKADIFALGCVAFATLTGAPK